MRGRLDRKEFFWSSFSNASRCVIVSCVLYLEISTEQAHFLAGQPLSCERCMDVSDWMQTLPRTRPSAGPAMRAAQKRYNLQLSSFEQCRRFARYESPLAGTLSV